MSCILKDLLGPGSMGDVYRATDARCCCLCLDILLAVGYTTIDTRLPLGHTLLTLVQRRAGDWSLPGASLVDGKVRDHAAAESLHIP